MCRQQHGFAGAALDSALAPFKEAISMVGVNSDLIVALGEPVELIVSQAQPPSRVVVARPVRNAIGAIWQRVEMRTEFLEAHDRIN